MATGFQELLDAARQQAQPQRLLFLFAQIEKLESKRNKQRQRGALMPLMCVDKLPEELSTFSAFAAEADQVSSEWDFMIVAGLDGEAGQPPSPEQAELHLNRMANDLAVGADLSRYTIFDRKAQQVVMQPG